MPRRSPLRLALRRCANQAKTIRSRCPGCRLRDCHVPSLANEDETRGLVSKYGHARPNWTILCDGDFQTYSVRGHNVRRSTRIVAVSKFVRGCGIF